MISAAGVALGSSNLGLGDNLAREVTDESEEVRRKRMQAARNSGYSPAGQALSIDYGLMSVPGA